MGGKNMIDLVKRRILQNLEVKQAIFSDLALLRRITKAAEVILRRIKEEKIIFFCGNGGSAADAQHLAAELQGKFYLERRSMAAISLTTNTSIISAISNDYDYSYVFSRQLEGLGKRGDVVVGISTSGNSKNILKVFKTAKEMEITTIGLTGSTGGRMKELSDILINIPSNDTARIQEAHILIGHIICEMVEKGMSD